MPDLPSEVRHRAARTAHGTYNDSASDLSRAGDVWERIVDNVAAVVESEIRRSLLLRSADLLDYQAAAHKESVVDYTDLLRVWAEDNKRWEQGR